RARRCDDRAGTSDRRGVMVIMRRLRPGRALMGTKLAAEAGNSLVEFVVLSAALLIPSLFLVLTLGNVHAAVFAADSIARDAARIHATEPDGSTASERSARHSEMILEDHGLPTGDAIALHGSH